MKEAQTNPQLKITLWINTVKMSSPALILDFDDDLISFD